MLADITGIDLRGRDLADGRVSVLDAGYGAPTRSGVRARRELRLRSSMGASR